MARRFVRRYPSLIASILTQRQCFRSHTCRQCDLLAEFCAPTSLRNPEEDEVPLVQLKVYPEGHERLDDILLSALVMERRRTTFDIVERQPILSKPEEPAQRRVWHYDAPTDVNQLHYL